MNSKVVICLVVLAICAICLEGKPRGKGKGRHHSGEKGRGKGKGHGHSSEEQDGSGLVFEDGEVAMVTCVNGTVINITDAKYGLKRKDCDPQAFQTVSNLCNGNETCSFMVDDMLFNDSDCDGSSSGSSSKSLKLKIQFECKGDPCDMPETCAAGETCVSLPNGGFNCTTDVVE